MMPADHRKAAAVSDFGFQSHRSRQHKWIASHIFFKNSCREEKLCFQVIPHAQSMSAVVACNSRERKIKQTISGGVEVHRK